MRAQKYGPFSEHKPSPTDKMLTESKCVYPTDKKNPHTQTKNQDLFQHNVWAVKTKGAEAAAASRVRTVDFSDFYRRFGGGDDYGEEAGGAAVSSDESGSGSSSGDEGGGGGGGKKQ
jgi:hypothetical protein